MQALNFDELLDKLKEDAINEDYPHEILAEEAMKALDMHKEIFSVDELTDEQEEDAINHWIEWFCKSELGITE